MLYDWSTYPEGFENSILFKITKICRKCRFLFCSPINVAKLILGCLCILHVDSTIVLCIGYCPLAEALWCFRNPMDVT